jgi:hypothetical protein
MKTTTILTATTATSILYYASQHLFVSITAFSTKSLLIPFKSVVTPPTTPTVFRSSTIHINNNNNNNNNNNKNSPNHNFHPNSRFHRSMGLVVVGGPLYMGRAAAVRAATKSKTDMKKAKINAIYGKRIIMAVKSGGSPDPIANRALNDVIKQAKANNVPVDVSILDPSLFTVFPCPTVVVDTSSITKQNTQYLLGKEEE